MDEEEKLEIWKTFRIHLNNKDDSVFSIFKASDGAAISSLTRLSHSSGLSPAQISALLSYLSSSAAADLNQSQFNQLIGLLVPSESLNESRVPVADFLLEYIHRIINCCQTDRGGGVRWRQKCENAAQNVTQWVNCLLRYSLFPLGPVRRLYEPLFLTLKYQCRPLRAAISKLLITLAEEKHVTKWRIKFLKTYMEKSGTKNSGALLDILTHYRILKPDLLQSHAIKAPTSSGRSSKNATSKMLESHFEQIWKDRSPLDSHLDELGSSSGGLGMDWDAGNQFVRVDQGISDKLENPLPLARRLTRSSRTQARSIRDPLPSLAANPLLGKDDHDNVDIDGEEEGSSTKRRRRAKKRKLMDLTQVRSMDVVFEHVRVAGGSPPLLSLPGQPLSLLRNRGLMLLLLINDDPDLVQKKFSVALYHTLYNEFFGSKGSLTRQRYILQRVFNLQDLLQQGIPVVARFLSQYLPTWDGQELFLEVTALLTYVQITEYEELHELLLSPFLVHFGATFTSAERLIFLHHVQSLLANWIQFEYQRCISSAKRPFGTANQHCRNPLHSIHELMGTFLLYVEKGLYFEEKTKLEKNSTWSIYISEVLFLCLKLSRLMLWKGIPLRLDLPSTLVYHSLFATTPIFLSKVLQHIQMTKDQVIPLCLNKLEEFRDALDDDTNYAADEEGRARDIELVETMVEDKEGLNRVTKDVLAVLSVQNEAYLDTGNSIFRLSWRIDDSKILDSLSIHTNMALMPFIVEFVDSWAKERNCTTAEAHQQMSDKDSPAYKAYYDHLSLHVNQVTDFLDMFERSKDQQNTGGGGGGGQLQLQQQQKYDTASCCTSTATSGVSSMQPSANKKKISSSSRGRESARRNPRSGEDEEEPEPEGNLKRRSARHHSERRS